MIAMMASLERGSPDFYASSDASRPFEFPEADGTFEHRCLSVRPFII